MSDIQISFTGGIADNHELNFYEAGRFQYGAARMIYTIEKFRQSGQVLQRLTSKIDADIRVKAAEPNCWLQEIFFTALPIVGACAIQVPLDVLFAYFWDRLIGQGAGTDTAIEMAKIEIEREKERTTQEGERTKQIELMANVANQNAATAQQAMDILSQALNDKPYLIDAVKSNTSKIAHLRTELEMQHVRESKLEPYSAELNKISKDDELKMLRQLRNPIRDISMPLEHSATNITVGFGEDQKEFLSADRETMSKIGNQTVDKSPTYLVGDFQRYDKTSGYGKFKFGDYSQPFSFRVPGPSKNNYKGKILDAMKVDNVGAVFYFVRNSDGIPISLIFDSISDEE